MQIKTRVTYDAGRLAKDMPKIIKGFLKYYTILTGDDIKDNIDRGLSPALRDSTLEIRKRRGIAGNKPLFATGSLYNSIKLKQSKESAKIVMLKYGKSHHEGFITGTESWIPNKTVPARPFIQPKKETLKKAFKSFEKKIGKSFKKIK